MNAFPWLLRREIWEHRAIYTVPLVFAGLLLLVYAWGLLGSGPGGLLQIDIDETVVDLRELVASDPRVEQGMKLAAGGLPFILPGILLNAVMLFLWFFYLTDTLYTERKDRSVLFWKSLPVADTTTVLSKLVTAMVVIPAITLVLVLAAAAIMTVVNAVFVWSIDESAREFVWSQVPFFSGPLTLAYALLVQSLWYAPLFGWLLLASAFARRAPALWALLPPAGVALLEGVVFRSSHFLELVGNRLRSVVPTAFHDSDFDGVIREVHGAGGDIDWSDAFGSLIDPLSFLTDPGMWAGLVVATVLVGGAVWLRRYREEL